MGQRLCVVCAAFFLMTAGHLSASDPVPAVIAAVSSHGVGPVSITPTEEGYDALIGDWPAVARFGCSFLYVDVDVRDGGTLTGTFQVQQSPLSDSYLDIYLLEPGVTWDPGTTWNESGTERCFRWDYPPGVVFLDSADGWGLPGWITPEYPLSVDLDAYAHQRVRVVFRQWSWGPLYDEAIQSRIHLDNERKLLVRAALGDAQLAPQDGVALPTEARVPLGGLLRIEAVDADGNPVEADFTLNDDAALEAGLASWALFRDAALLAYAGEPAHRAAYQAVHKGRVTITVKPQSPDIPEGTLTVVVEDPVRLGAANNDVDSEIFEVAHASGILPQFIKAHVEQESRFNRLAYRYEPLSPYVGDLGAVSRGENYRTQAPFQNYRLETAADTVNAALAEGSFLLPADRDARGGLYIDCAANGTGGRRLLPTDELVDAAEIVRCNDRTNARMNWIANAGAQGHARAARLRTDPFTAQTPLAASFGLLQVTYVTAIVDLAWTGNASGRKNPSSMFDTEENHQANLGSLWLGSQLDARNFRRTLRGFGGEIDSYEVLLLLFNNTWQLYNPGMRGYGVEVATKVPRHLPVERRPALGGAQ